MHGCPPIGRDHARLPTLRRATVHDHRRGLGTGRIGQQGLITARCEVASGTVIVVSVCSLKGGVGKTSVVLGLASAALARGVPTLVVDLDPQADATLSLDITTGLTSDVATVLGASRRNI